MEKMKSDLAMSPLAVEISHRISRTCGGYPVLEVFDAVISFATALTLEISAQTDSEPLEAIDSLCAAMKMAVNGSMMESGQMDVVVVHDRASADDHHQKEVFNRLMKLLMSERLDICYNVLVNALGSTLVMNSKMGPVPATLDEQIAHIALDVKANVTSQAMLEQTMDQKPS